MNGLTIIFAPKFQLMITRIASAQELQGIVNTSENLLIYFYSDDCAPCMSLRPKVEEMIQSKFPLMDMVYVEGKSFPALMADFQVYSFPVLLFFFEGKEFLRYSKYVSIAELTESIGRIYSLYHSGA